MEANPYAPPQAEIATPPPLASEAVHLRKEHLNTEATIKSVGSLCWLIAFFLIVNGVRYTTLGEASTGLPLLLIGAFAAAMAYGLRRLLRWTRIPILILAIPLLIAVPVGTLVSIMILVNVGSKKGSFIMTPAYRQIIAQTPEIKYKSSSTPVLVLLALIGILVIVGLLAYLWFR